MFDIYFRQQYAKIYIYFNFLQYRVEWDFFKFHFYRKKLSREMSDFPMSMEMGQTLSAVPQVLLPTEDM